MKNTQVARLLAYVTGLVNQQLLLQNEYLIAENRILRSHLPARVPLTNAQRATLAEIAKRMGRRALEQVASVAKPETILAWYRKLIARKFDGSKHRAYPGRPAVSREITELVVRMARENGSWGYDRIAGALKNLGHNISDQTVGNILRRFGIAPAPKRRQQTTWADFIRSHMAVLAGIDFFTVEVLTWRGLATYYVLFFCTWKRDGSRSPESPNIPRRNGWCRWLAMRSTTSMALFLGPALRCMTATQSSATHSEPC